MDTLTKTVGVLRRVQNGTDAMGEPVWEWEGELVDGVLLRPLEPGSISEASNREARPDGSVERYELSFPKTYTKPLAHCKLWFPHEGQTGEPDDAYDVEGYPRQTPSSPLTVNRRVFARRVHG